MARLAKTASTFLLPSTPPFTSPPKPCKDLDDEEEIVFAGFGFADQVYETQDTQWNEGQISRRERSWSEATN